MGSTSSWLSRPTPTARGIRSPRGTATAGRSICPILRHRHRHRHRHRRLLLGRVRLHPARSRRSAIDKTKTIYGQTKQICFESFTAVLVSFFYSPCAIPKTSNLLLSTNG
jgi:hypothetical protein